MFRYTTLLVAAGALALGVPADSPTTGGNWQIDAGHSDAQIITDATTDYGKTKLDVTLGFARVQGRMDVDNDDLAKSSFDFRMYPATAMTPAIDEDGKFLTHWLANMSNHTLMCFHAKGATRLPDGRIQTTGTLVLTRVDRYLDATPSEAYAGPVYGPPVIHRVSHDATFVFKLPNGSKGQDGEVVASGSTTMFREDYPQLLRAAVSTYWPLVVQDKNCQPPANPGEDYRGSQCTGTVLDAPGLPEPPRASNGEDLSAASNYNAVVGNRLNIQVHLRLSPRSSGQAGAGGN